MTTAPVRLRLVAAAAAVALVLTPALAEARTIKGDNKANKIIGTQKADTITAYNGDDHVAGRGGADKIGGGTGNDVLSGGAGNDVLLGNAGDDRLVGGAGDDQLKSDVGDDQLIGGDGDDVLEGYDGNDHLFGQAGDDFLHGLDGNDYVDGGAGSDHVQGGEGDDRVYGGGDRDEIDGDEGDDFIDGGSGSSSCPGFDDTAVNSCKLRTSVPKGPGFITPNITADAGDDVVYPGAGVDDVFGDGGFDTIVVTDDGAYDRLFCADYASEPDLGGPPATRGRIVYVSTSGTRIDPLDDIKNCDYDPQNPSAADDEVFTMTPAQFTADPSLVYPDTGGHLPLPAGVR